MPAGRPRQPQELVKATLNEAGTHVSGHPLPEPMPAGHRAVMVPDPPEHLLIKGKEAWTDIWTAGWWLHEEDHHWVAIIASAYDEIAAFRRQVRKDGLTVEGYNGQTTAHPLIKEIREAERQIMKALSTLGFSPSDRARLGIQEAKKAKAVLELRDKMRASSRPPIPKGDGAW